LYERRFVQQPELGKRPAWSPVQSRASFLAWIWRPITPENPAERPRVNRDQPTRRLCGPSALEKSEMRTPISFALAQA
jgi:hypothetical protein